MNTPNRFAGQTAIITGASKGIGAAYARALAREGANVVIADIQDGTATAQAITDIGGKACFANADVTSAESMAELARLALENFGRIDILVNNAGLFADLQLKPFDQISSSEWDRLMAVNVRGPFEGVKAVYPAMKAQGYGKIINIASGTVFKGSPMMLHYVTSKGAVTAMTRCLARELGDHGIRVNTLAPGLVMTETVLANPSWQGVVTQNNVASRAIKREAVPEDIVGAMLFLASRESDFITGQVVVVDGGSVMH